MKKIILWTVCTIFSPLYYLAFVAAIIWFWLRTGFADGSPE